MKTHGHEIFYLENHAYTKILDDQKPSSFKKYVDFVYKYSGGSGRFLDVGCGTGIALTLIPKAVSAIGIDVSKTSVEACLKKGLDCTHYDGEKIPYPDKSFDVVGSFDVLEHTDDPVNFLNEQYRVVKSGGALIVACPNFLSLTNSYHHHTAGFFQKVKNSIALLQRIRQKNPQFKKMKTITRPDFHSDDDACNITNPLDIIAWSKGKKLRIAYWSGLSIYKVSIIKQLDLPVVKSVLGSSFIVFQKVDSL